MTNQQRIKRALNQIKAVRHALAYGPQHGPEVNKAITPLACAQSDLASAYRAICNLENMSNNPNCDGSGPHAAGEVRILPVSANPDHGNMILCRNCYHREIAYREDCNKTLASNDQFALPVWDSLKIYGGNEQ